MNKSDIDNRKDIEKLINTFYTKVKKDAVVGHFFTEVVTLSWEHHMPTMYDFWESVLFGTAKYRGNPIMKHIELDRKSDLTEVHFAQWKKLFFETVDDLFEGQRATLAKERVTMMEQLMLFKIKASREDGFVQ